MRIFQFHAFYQPYQDYFNRVFPALRQASFSERLKKLLDHRFMAPHILEPAGADKTEFFFTVGNDPHLQRQWAREHGLVKPDLLEILRAQMEEHRAEVVYCLAPSIYDSQFIRRLPGCVKKTICWHASPLYGRDLSTYDLRLCNFPMLLEEWKASGWRGAWFSPSHDPAMAPFANNQDRPVDVAFVGQYSPNHTTRNRLLDAVAHLGQGRRVEFRLMCRKWRPLAECRILHRIPLPIPYLPKPLRRVSGPPVFGSDMYELFGRSKIVFNAAIDMSGIYRGNMRCFEALGCGACMISDEGTYADGLKPGEHFETFTSEPDLRARIDALLAEHARRQALANRGRRYIENTFPKSRQWEQFQRLAAEL